LENLLRLGEAFENWTLADSLEMIGLIFSENFTYQERKIKTAIVNEMVSCIFLVNNRLMAKKKRNKR
jgi:site-specific DNA recombinase